MAIYDGGLSIAVKGLPCGKRVHVVSPTDNLSVLDGDDGDKPVVIGSAGFQSLAVNLVFQNNDAIFLVMMNDKVIAFVNLDAVAIPGISGYQILAPTNLLRPTGETVEKLKFGVV